MGSKSLKTTREMDSTNKVSRSPSFCALFLVAFDLRIGYVKQWHRVMSTDLDLDGVEYKCLPSGLHETEEDVVYFQHEGHIGVSVFMRRDGSAAERNARMRSIGLLMPLKAKSLGKCWQFLHSLRELLRSIMNRAEEGHHVINQLMSQFYGLYEDTPPETDRALQHKHSSTEQYKVSTPMISEPSYGKERTASKKSITRALSLSEDHPARCLIALVKEFGPLIFPVYRALIIGQRVMIFSEVPVKKACEYVYAFSLLSAIPLPMIEEFADASFRTPRVDVLFCIGVHDIPKLEEVQRRRASFLNGEEGTISWIACTTDSILQSKSKLYDVAITRRKDISKETTNGSRWMIHTSERVPIKASARDHIEYNLLIQQCFHQETDIDQHEESPPTLSNMLQMCTIGALDDLLYNGYIWWASAGERFILRRNHLAVCVLDHEQQHEELLMNHETGTMETDIIAFFRRRTIKLLTGILEITHSTSQIGSSVQHMGDEQLSLIGTSNEHSVTFGRHEFERLGLDIRIEQDRAFLYTSTILFFQTTPDVKRFARCCSFCV